MNISEISNLSGLPVKTIRFYEDIGLVCPARRQNRYRNFSEVDAHKLRFLATARSLGFSIEECRELLSLYDDQGRASSDVKAIAKAHLKTMTHKIKALQALHAVLSHLIEVCHGDDRPDCPIIDGMSSGITITTGAAQ